MCGRDWSSDVCSSDLLSLSELCAIVLPGAWPLVKLRDRDAQSPAGHRRRTAVESWSCDTNQPAILEGDLFILPWVVIVTGVYVSLSLTALLILFGNLL